MSWLLLAFVQLVAPPDGGPGSFAQVAEDASACSAMHLVE